MHRKITLLFIGYLASSDKVTLMNPFKITWHWFERMSSPRHFYRTTGSWIPWLAAITLFLLLAGAIIGLFYADEHPEQRQIYRILYVHVPAASLSLMIYVAMAFAAAISLVWRLKMAEIITLSLAPVGAALTFLTLITGSLWGSETWNTWWAWDARMTSELFLLFLYMGVMGLGNAIEDRRSAAQATAILILSTVAIIPFIIISVNPELGFGTLHQSSTAKFDNSQMGPSVRRPYLFMVFGFIFFIAWAVIMRARTEILFRERNTQWVKKEISQ